MSIREWRWQFGNAPRRGEGPVIDMTPEGQFAAPPQPPLSSKILGIAILIAVVAGVAGLAMLAFYVAMLLIPVALGAAAIAYLAYRFQRWRAGDQSLGGQRNVWRP
jgi:hypothetical protein